MKNKNSAKNMRWSKILTVLLLISLAYGAYNTVRVQKLKSQRQAIIKENESKINMLKSEIEDMKKEIETSNSLEFVEKIARDELGMVKPREIIVVDKNKKIESKPQQNN